MRVLLRSFLLPISVLILTLGAAFPARADDDPPPGDVTADAPTLTRAWDVAPGAYPSQPMDLVVYNGVLYFSADSNNGLGRELRALGNPNTINIYPGAIGSFPQGMTVYNGALYFGANGGDGFGHELWKYDTTNGPARVADVNTGGDANINHLAVFNNVLYFQASTPATGTELFKYDPVNGAQLAADVAPGATGSAPTDMMVYKNELYFHADGANGAGDELWKYNTTDGAQLVMDLYPGAGSSSPWFLTPYDGAIYFTADGNNGAGRELWKYDLIDGAQLAADIMYGGTGSDPWWFGTYNGDLYFSRNYQLWRYDPIHGVDQVPEFGCPYTYADPQSLVEYNNALYMGLDCNDGTGRELWMYNNTAQVIVRPSKSYDGWLLESGETTSKGGTLNNTAPTFNLGDNNQDRQVRSILSFNTSSLPDNAVIIEASLKIRQQGLVGTNPFTTHGNILIDIIQGAFSGNNSLQLSDFQAAPGKTGVGKFTNFPDVNNWYTSLLSKSSHPYINPLGVTQLRLRFAKDDNDDNGADFLKFYSADSALLTDFPILIVKYYFP